MQREERRAQILRTAAGAFVASGHDATSIDDVAAAAGITKVIVYRHFDGKTELYRAILDEVTALLAVTYERLETTGSEYASLESLLLVARALPDAFTLLTVHAAREPAFAEYAHVVREAMENAGRQRLEPHAKGHEHVGWVVSLGVDTAIAAVLQWLAHGDPDRDDEFIRRTSAGIAALVAAELTPAQLLARPDPRGGGSAHW